MPSSRESSTGNGAGVVAGSKPTPSPSGSFQVTPRDETVSVFNSDQVHFEIDLNEWKPIDDQEGIQTYEKRESIDGLVAFRGETNIPADLPKIATILNTPELRPQWVDAYGESHLIERLNDYERIEYIRTKVPWPLQDRDIVYHAKAKVHQSPPQMLIEMKSVADPREPEKSGVVRAEMVHSYYYLKQVEGVRSTKVIVEMAVDPKGAIPKWLVNLSQKRWPLNTLLNLRKISMREDIPVSKRIQEYFLKEKQTRKKKR